MKSCLQCGGLMEQNRESEVCDEFAHLNIQGWRCLLCSEEIEEIVTFPQRADGKLKRISYAIRQ